MDRYANEDLSEFNLPEDNTQVTYIISNGNKLTQKDYDILKDKPKVYAKYIYDSSTNKFFYYILCAGGLMFDPKQEKDSRYVARNNWKFRKVNQDAFNLYTSFLEKKYNNLLYQAERCV